MHIQNFKIFKLINLDIGFVICLIVLIVQSIRNTALFKVQTDQT